MPKEIELKLSLPANSIKYLLHLPLLNDLSVSEPIKHKLYSTYFDTPDLALMKHHCALRIRRMGKQWIQTIKTEGTVSSGLHERNEWEIPIANNQLDFSQLSEPNMIKLLSNENISRKLQPIFITEFIRHMRMIQLSNGGLVEVSLDQGKVIVENKEESFTEIELELKSGKPAQLFQFALTLIQSIPFPARLENTSKAERGYKLYSGHQAPPIMASSVLVTHDMDHIAVFILIMRNCLDQLTRNEQGVLVGYDIEYLRQMRIALHRLRITVLLFASAIPTETFIMREFEWLIREFDATYLWNRFAAEQLPQIHKVFAKHPGMQTLIQASETLLKKHNKQVQNSIKSRRYSELILQLNLWLDEIDHCPAPMLQNLGKPAKETLSAFANCLLTNFHQEIVEYSNNLEQIDAISLDELILKIEKLRYLAELCYLLYPDQEKASAYIRLVANLQDLLGVTNDKVNIQKLLSEMPSVKTKSCMTREAMGIILGWNSQSMQQKRKELQSILLTLRDAPIFWDA